MMKSRLILFLVLSGSGISARAADVAAIVPGSKEETVANVANGIFSVTNLQIGKWTYQIVSMDSALNGDLNTTTIVLVGEGEVGGAAGYQTAFKLSPADDLLSLKSAAVQNGQLALTFYNMDGKLIQKLYSYDASSKSLKESSGN